jgi:hypothetical protein
MKSANVLLSFFNRHKSVLVLFLSFLIISAGVCIYLPNSLRKTGLLIEFKLHVRAFNESYRAHDAYLVDISAQRLNKLLDILHEKEKTLGWAMRHLGLLMFDNITQDTDGFLTRVDQHVRVTDPFLRYLHNITDFYVLKRRRNVIQKRPIERKEDKPVILMASDSKYYLLLQATLHNIHKYMPDYEIIVYDLGLSPREHNMVVL